jgi:hypothetical protein
MFTKLKIKTTTEVISKEYMLSGIKAMFMTMISGIGVN